MSTKTRTAKAAPETDKAGGYKGSAQIGIVTFLVGTLIAVYLFFTNPDPKSFEEYNFLNTGLCLWLPLMVILFVFRQEPNQFGLTRGDQKLGMKWVWIAWIGMLLPLVYYSHLAPAKQFYVQGRLESYYLSGLGTVLNPILHTVNYKALLYFELGMGFYMFCWEFFFRGFLLFGLQKSRLGPWGAVAIQAVLFMLLHWAWKDHNHAAKPTMETWSALPGGVILGILAIKTRSFIYGFLAHWAISVTLDLFLLVPFITHQIG